MQAHVITIMDNEKSVQVANRCIASGNKHGVEVTMWPAITPKDDIKTMFRNRGISDKRFNEIYSRTENCMAAFLSHLMLWEKADRSKENILILEHDAVFVSSLPTLSYFKGVISLGQPSYGKYETPRFMGSNKLQSKQYFGGAHAYVMSWQAAPIVLAKAKQHGAPTDLFFHNENFPFLEEYYPWPIVAKDNFTTIQSVRGVAAKHNFGAGYDII
jgi:GR25 family glycosyltransferase involved in LPS biosynthesis